MAANLINSKAHLTLEGLYKIVEIKASNNTGLNANLKKAFPNIKGIIRSSVNISDIAPNGAEWVAGFVSGDGKTSSMFSKSKAKTGIGYKVQMRFRLTQHIRDKDLFI